MTRVAIVGLACRYPDADAPGELWTNILAGRRAFRRLPDERMRLADYWSADPAAPDRFYAQQAAVIEGYRFDRVRYRVAGSTYRSTDLTHWLALDVATEALADAGFPGGDDLPRERTGVVVGNSLTGEFVRANLMRLRWPYVQRTVAAGLRAQGWDDAQLAPFLADLEQRYKHPFPPIDEDTLAGGLSNTIAGRICNYYDLKGGGYTVDGACSSSLLSVATACRALSDNEIDVAIAGGVDLSIDPFEIVGFAKTGALATGEMRVYDRQSSGFWPGEGCGMVVLMRESDARAAGRRSYATIAGWGISSDGKGGITRPEVAGYRLVLRRAYRRAGFGIDTVSLFEGHGTGTPVGNDTELGALSAARRESGPDREPAAIGSIKAMIGHTKAAAGVAGLIKATLAVYHEVLPPTVGCHDPHPVLREESPALRVLPVAEPWPRSAPVRAAVTAMGFGGINTHLVVENPRPQRPAALPARSAALTRHAPGGGAELLVFDAADADQLRQRVSELAEWVSRISYAELGDLAVELTRRLADGRHRAAVVASSPAEAARRLARLAARLADTGQVWDPAEGSFAGPAASAPRLGFLLPGQGSGNQPAGGALRWRFPEAEHTFTQADLPVGADPVATAVAQPRIATGSLAGLRVLAEFGVEATVAVGHSLGELAALHWAGSFNGEALLRLAAIRGRVMTDHSDPGTMASVAGAPEQVEPLLAGTGAVVAGYNGPGQTVVAGTAEAVATVCDRAAAAGLGQVRMPVSHAFHSPLVARASAVFAEHLAREPFAPVERAVISTVTGHRLAPDTDLPALLAHQITEPVRFASALRVAAAQADLFLEVGPGMVLSRLAAAAAVPALSIDTDSASLAPLWMALGATFVAGAPIRWERLAAGRPERRLNPGAALEFFSSPCEAAPEDAAPALLAPVAITAGEQGAVPLADAEPVEGSSAAVPTAATGGGADVDTVSLLRGLVAVRAELPDEAVQADSHLLDDLHLSSITVGQVFVQAAQQLGLPVGQAPTSFATATLRDLSAALDELRQTGGERDSDQPEVIAGVRGWVEPFVTEFVPVPASQPAAPAEPDGGWRAFAPDGHPLAGPLREALERAGLGGGVLVCASPDCGQADLGLALRGAQAAVAQAEGGRLVMVQHGRGAAAVAKTARLEAPHLRTTVVDTPLAPEAVDRIVADAAATTGFLEVRYDEAGNRLVPRLRHLTLQDGDLPPLSASDVLLVTGGGRGITAECALALAADSGARLAVLGRADPATDPELAANLARMTEAGVTVRYERADVTDISAVEAAVAAVTAEFGPVTAILHGAGGNEPAALPQLTPEAFARALAPKVDGLAALLNAVDGSLRLLVTFGSIIGRAGLRGEAHYALANDWLAQATVEAAARFPGCRVLCLEWSVWSGVGMGERLSVVQSLVREGITPITVEQGVAALRRLLAGPHSPPVVVVTGRVGGIDTLAYRPQPLPLLRFLDRPLVHYPEVELVAESTLSSGSDLYLDDHDLDGNLLFPAVLGMEAMTQVVTALRGGFEQPLIEQAEFLRPIVVTRAGETTVRVAALRTGADHFEVVIRSSETGYGADHFRAKVSFPGEVTPNPAVTPGTDDVAPVPLVPIEDLYGKVLFQGGRFQRLRRYRRVAARRAEAEVVGRVDTWFAPYLSGELVLGDPGARDALLHGLQVCVPDATLLPEGFDRWSSTATAAAATKFSFTAVERLQVGDSYVYDIMVRGADGALVERWDGLRLRAVGGSDGRGPWPAPLLGPYLERALERMLGARLTVVVEPGDGRATTAVAVRRALGREVTVRYRPDGRPEVPGGGLVTAAHGAGATLVVAAEVPVGGDLEPVATLPAERWQALLQPHGRLLELLRGHGEGCDLAATRLWCALEALQKCGEWRGAPVTVESRSDGSWMLLRSGRHRVATFATSLTGVEPPVVFAVAVGEES